MSLKPKKNRLVQSNGINWQLIKQIDDGGNGLIWTAHQELNSSEICVFKFIPPATESKNINPVRLKREFEVHTELYKKKYNVLPVFDYSFNPKAYSWLRLPLAKTFKNGVAETAFLQKIQLLIQLCKDIQALHSNDYCHRDIKPNNLLFLEDKLYLADFGLVTDPKETTGITPNGTRMGNYQTIAPEMRKTGKNLETEDYKKSDIYSLGVTIWMILTQDEHGFDGEYSASQKEKLEEVLFKEKIVFNNIHSIIEGCTKTNPIERISLQEIISILNQVESSLQNYSKYIDSKWEDVCYKLNPYQASKIELTDIKTIFNFLNTFYGFEPDLHHAFFPDTGGLDIRGLELNEKDGFIILNLGSFKNWLKPKRLIYRHFKDDISNNYIYLECADIPHFQDDYSPKTMEYTLVNNQFLTDFKHWQFSLFEEINIHEIASRITIVHNGSFLFTKSFSAYDRSDECYDAVHSKNFKNFEEFDQYFCNTYTETQSDQNETRLPFEYKIEEKNISAKVDLLHLNLEEISKIINGLKYEQHGDEFGIISSSKIFKLMLRQNELEKENQIFLETYSIEKIREFWCLYNLGKQYGWTIEMSAQFYQQFYENYSSYNWDMLTDKISSRSTSALIDFINRALRNLKHTEFLDDFNSNTNSGKS